MHVADPVGADAAAELTVLAFVPSTAAPRPARSIERASTVLRYWAVDTSRGQAQALSGDPAGATVPMTKVVLNAVSIFVVFLIAGLALVAIAPVLFGYQPVVVTSGSMEPSIKMADIVLTAPSDGLGLERGTVINFDQEGVTLLHRIEEALEAGYRTAGDANPSPDSDLVSPAQIRGVGIAVIPFVGLPRMWMVQGQWLKLAIALALLAAALYMSRSRWLDDELANLAVEAHS